MKVKIEYDPTYYQDRPYRVHFKENLFSSWVYDTCHADLPLAEKRAQELIAFPRLVKVYSK